MGMELQIELGEATSDTISAAGVAASPKPLLVKPVKSKTTNSKSMAKTSQATGMETRGRIIDAARVVLREDGITQASARNIARRGDFNQALIFYHFGSLDGLFIAVAQSEGQQRADLYAEQFQRIAKLSELVRIARDVHAHEISTGGPTVLSQLLAGALSSEPIASGMVEAMRPWMTLVESAMGQTLAATPLASLLPKEEMAFAVASLFIGMELLTSLEPESKKADKLFDAFASLGNLADLVMSNPQLIGSALGIRPEGD
jgi:AcrR family transcriptional regulator